jgi:hypothetical protein
LTKEVMTLPATLQDGLYFRGGSQVGRRRPVTQAGTDELNGNAKDKKGQQDGDS